jgi:hypothetical protein
MHHQTSPWRTDVSVSSTQHEAAFARLQSDAQSRHLEHREREQAARAEEERQNEARRDAKRLADREVAARVVQRLFRARKATSDPEEKAKAAPARLDPSFIDRLAAPRKERAREAEDSPPTSSRAASWQECAAISERLHGEHSAKLARREAEKQATEREKQAELRDEAARARVRVSPWRTGDDAEKTAAHERLYRDASRLESQRLMARDAKIAAEMRSIQEGSLHRNAPLGSSERACARLAAVAKKPLPQEPEVPIKPSPVPKRGIEVSERLYRQAQEKIKLAEELSVAGDAADAGESQNVASGRKPISRASVERTVARLQGDAQRWAAARVAQKDPAPPKLRSPEPTPVVRSVSPSREPHLSRPTSPLAKLGSVKSISVGSSPTPAAALPDASSDMDSMVAALRSRTNRVLGLSESGSDTNHGVSASAVDPLVALASELGHKPHAGIHEGEVGEEPKRYTADVYLGIQANEHIAGVTESSEIAATLVQRSAETEAFAEPAEGWEKGAEKSEQDQSSGWADSLGVETF